MPDRYQKAIDEAARHVNPERIERLREVQKKIDDLKSRGLLKKQEYKSFTTSGLGKQHHRHK